MTDEVIPRFWKRRAAGEVFMNPMSYAVKSFGLTRSSSLDFTMTAPTLPYYLVRCNWQGSQCANRFGLAQSPALSGSQLPASGLSIDSATIANLVTEASTKALAQRGQSQNNLWESIAEMDKSLKMVPDMFLEVRNIVKKTASAKYKRNVKSLYVNNTASRIATTGFQTQIARAAMTKINAAASLYLAYRYGIKPLLNDIDGILKGFTRAAGRVRQTSRGEAIAKTSSTIELADPFAVGGYTRINFNLKVQRDLAVKVRAMSLDEYNIGALFNMGLSAKGFVGTAYELIPYSFVVDWVANVGDMFNALLPSSVARALGSCVVIESDEHIRATTYSSEVSSTARQDAPDIGTYSGHIITRERTPGALIPGLVIKSDFKLTNATRVADAASLLLQTMRHPFR